jgi:hypothetical protein
MPAAISTAVVNRSGHKLQEEETDRGGTDQEATTKYE